MAYPPGQSLTVRDGGVGVLLTQASLPLIVGVSAGGTANTLYQYSDPNTLLEEQVGGPAVELALAVMNASGAVMFLKTASSTAGSNGSVTATLVGDATGTITVAGTPNDSYEVIVDITKTGTLGAGKFIYSLDDGRTYSSEYLIPAGATFAIPGTGLTLTFVPGEGDPFFEAGDRHNFDSTAPHYTTSDIGTAWSAMLAALGSRKVRRVFFAGKNASASSAATMAAAVATHMATLETNNYYARAMLDGGTDNAATTVTDLAAFTDDRVAIVYGDIDVVTLNPFAGWGAPKMPLLLAAAERAAAADLSENLGRKGSGSLRGVVAVSHDERIASGFTEADKIITSRTYTGQVGFFLTNGYLRSPAGSDFLYWDWGCTIDEICETIFEVQDRFLLSKFRALTDGTGNIDPRDAARVEAAVRAALKARLIDPTNIEGTQGHVSGLSYAVDLTNDYLATRTLRSTCAAVPLSPAETISTVIGFARAA